MLLKFQYTLKKNSILKTTFEVIKIQPAVHSLITHGENIVDAPLFLCRISQKTELVKETSRYIRHQKIISGITIDFLRCILSDAPTLFNTINCVHVFLSCLYNHRKQIKKQHKTLPKGALCCFLQNQHMTDSYDSNLYSLAQNQSDIEKERAPFFNVICHGYSLCFATIFR